MAKSTKDLIYSGALKAFSQKGFAETTMDLIADTAGVAKGTLYYNFGSKEELFAYVMRRGIDQLTRVMADAFAKQNNPMQKWEHVIQTQLDFYEENRSFLHLLIQNMWGVSQTRLSLQELLGEYFATLDHELQKAQQEGHLSQDLDVQTLSSALFGTIIVPAARACLRGQRINEEKRVHTLTHLVLQYMGGGDVHESV